MEIDAELQKQQKKADESRQRLAAFTENVSTFEENNVKKDNGINILNVLQQTHRIKKEMQPISEANENLKDMIQKLTARRTLLEQALQLAKYEVITKGVILQQKQEEINNDTY